MRVNNENKIAVTGLLIAFLLVFFDLCIINNTSVYYDSWGYQAMSNYFTHNGLFSFWVEDGAMDGMGFDTRGYAWPWLIALFSKLSFGNIYVYRLLYALFVAGGISFALPEMISKLFDKQVGIIGRVLPMVFTMFFWNGLIIYPLTDIPSIIMVIWGLYFLISISKGNELKGNLFIIKSIMAGIALGCAYYIRSGCLPVIYLVLFYIICCVLNNYRRKKAIVFIGCVIGLFIAMIPQILINYTYNNTFSYEVPIFFTTHIANAEYYNGFSWLRYETNIGTLHTDAAMISKGGMIDIILAAENLPSIQMGLVETIKLILKYPFEFLGMYATKFATSIDPRYGRDLYLVELSAKQYVTMFTNYFIWFICFLSVTINLNKDNGHKSYFKGNVVIKNNQVNNCISFINKYFIFVLAILLPGLIHLLGTHIESRYFFSAYLIVYMYVSGVIDIKEILSYIKEHIVTVLVIFIALFGCLNAIWNYTFENFPQNTVFYQETYTKQEIVKEEFLESYEILDATNLTFKAIGVVDNILCMDVEIKTENVGEIDQVKVGLISEDEQLIKEINIYKTLEGECVFYINESLNGVSLENYEIVLLIETQDENYVCYTGQRK